MSRLALKMVEQPLNHVVAGPVRIRIFAIEVQQPGGLRVAAMPWAQQTGVKIGDFFAKHETHGDQELG
ncbi:MAG: hypothetical protein EBV16_01945 [Betaproteobacteria bacterium]|nr:hypothetical protein [Betaproteobacteria bacterium]